MAQKVVKARKMKSGQETTSLSQIAKVTAKPTFINSDTRPFKIQTGDMGPPLAGPQFLLLKQVKFLLFLFSKTKQLNLVPRSSRLTVH